MKNLNKVRNSRESNRCYLIFSNEEDALRRLWLMYKDYPSEIDNENDQFWKDRFGFGHILAVCMPAHVKNDMVAAVGLERLGKEKYWALK